MKLSKSISTYLSMAFSWALCLVIVFNLFIQSIHHTNHHHEQHETTCSAELENDACHRYLFHNQKSENCDGSHQHLTEKTEACFACEYNSSNHFSILSPLYVISIEKKIVYSVRTKPSAQVLNDHSTPQLRGPPFIG